MLRTRTATRHYIGAAREGRTDIAKLLIAKGANVNAKAKKDVRPLRLAIEMDRKDVIEVLKQHGAKE